ncbi:C-type lectin domain family 4 member E-like [Leuresthes tenuis]|uniref:C-type lectin domain family 4 member E-like n=1 Tax=Leuresthes tenuis TaxID=355514 RepID=UPI003B502959
MSRQRYSEGSSGDAAASHHEKPNRGLKLTSERGALLVLCALLAAALIVIYRLSEFTLLHFSFVFLESHQTFQTLKEENEALRKDLSDENKAEALWERHGGKYYYFSTMKSSWIKSRDECRRKGGDLVKINSREEQRFLEIRVRDKMEEDEDKFWIGLTDSEEQGSWLWADGSPLDTRFTFWNGHEPDNWREGNPDGEDCVRMGMRGGAEDLKCWFDKVCAVPHRSICEKEAGSDYPEFSESLGGIL